jgi:hypothetical protein
LGPCHLNDTGILFEYREKRQMDCEPPIHNLSAKFAYSEPIKNIWFGDGVTSVR